MMKKTINFTETSVDTASIQEYNVHKYQRIKPDWTKVVIRIKNSNFLDLEEKVNNWCNENCSKSFVSYSFHINNWSENTLVFRFESREDAVLFKLSGIFENDVIEI